MAGESKGSKITPGGSCRLPVLSGVLSVVVAVGVARRQTWDGREAELEQPTQKKLGLL